MLKKLSILALVVLLAFAVVACGGGDSGAAADPIAAFLAEYGDDLTAEIMEDLGGGGSAELEAGSGNNELVLTLRLEDNLGDGRIEMLFDILGSEFEFIAEELAEDIGVDSVRLTVRLYDSDGNSGSRSFDS